MTIEPLFRPAASWLAAAMAAIVLTGCAHGLQREGLGLIEEGQYEAGLAALDEAVAQSPHDARVRLTRTVQYEQVVARLLAQADRQRAEGNYDLAEESYRRVLAIEPANARATEALRQLEQFRTLAERVRQGQLSLRRGDVEGAERQVSAVLALDRHHEAALALKTEIEELRARTASPYPQLRSKFSRPVSLEFRDANLKMIFEVLSRTAGINFIFDKEVKPDLKATIFVRQVAVEDAVDLLLMQNQLLKKVINDNTVVIYPDTPQKIKEYQDLALRTFFLSNLDAKSALNMVKTLLKTRDVFIDERLNTLTMRDTAEAVRLAEKLLSAQDQAEPEVVLELEVLEISRQRILDLGISWPNRFEALSPTGATIGLLSELRGVVGRPSRIAINGGPVARINANDNDFNTLANPVLRVRNKEKARIHIGDKIPIVSATSTPSTQGPVTTESVTYLDVGLKIELEPTVHLNDEVGIKILLEVSNATPAGETANGTTLVNISTRNASTGLRLKDGETQVLAGLLRNDRSNSGDKIPGLGDIPGVGRLFGSNKDTIAKTELVLAITPRIVRNLPYLSPHETEFPSGTDAALRVRPVSLRASDDDAPQARAAAIEVARAPAAAPEPVEEAPAPPLVLAWEGPAALKPGEEATIVLQGRADQPLRSATYQVAWNPAALRVVEVSEGELLKQGGGSTSFSPRLDENAGRLFVATSRSGAGADGATGEGELLRLRVTALEPQAEAVPLRLLTFTAVGPANRLLTTPLPAPLEVNIAP